MLVSKNLIQRAASDIRAAEGIMSRTVLELRDAGVWVGADAERFQQEWNDLVKNRLRVAAGTLDVVSIVTLG